MTGDEFAAQTEGKVEHRGIQVRQVHNGFVIVTNRRFLDPDTETETFSLGQEGVAGDTKALLAALDRFFTTGDMTGEA